MASIADFLLNVTGRADPRAKLAQAIAGGAPGQPGGDGMPTAPGTAPATGAPAPVPEAQAYQSPSQLIDLYMQLQDRQVRSRQIDRGIGLMGASLAHPENRAGILATFNGGGGGNDPGNMISNLVDFQTKSMALQQKAAQRNTVPSIASQYGLDPTTALYLFDTGKLDSVIAELEKPNNEVVKGADGKDYIVDRNSGLVTDLGIPGPKRELEVQEGADGSKIVVYKDTKEPVEGREPLVPEEGNTDFEKNFRNAQKERPNLTREQFRRETNRTSQSDVTFVDANGNSIGDPPKDMTWDRDASGKVKVDERGAPIAVPIGGTEIDLKQKAAEAEKADAEKAAAGKASQKTVQGGIVGQDIDRAIKVIDDTKDQWIGATGWSSLLSKIPATEARFLEQTLNTIKANVGFDKLQAMRDSSPTGAALGPVSDFENQLLQATSGALDQGGDPEVLKFNLRRIQKIFSVIGDTKITPENVDIILGDVGGAGFTPATEELNDEDLVKKWLR